MTLILSVFTAILLLMPFLRLQLRNIFTRLHYRLTTIFYSSFFFNQLPAMAGMALVEGEADGTGESPKDTGNPQPIKQTYR